jgi:hypothetical protein
LQVAARGSELEPRVHGDDGEKRYGGEVRAAMFVAVIPAQVCFPLYTFGLSSSGGRSILGLASLYAILTHG